MTDTRTCPCCGQSAPPDDGVTVSLTENRLFYREHSIHLSARLAELAYILAKRMPETVVTGSIIQQLWGDCEGDFADTNVKVAVCQLRKVLQPIGLQIITTWGKGYRLAALPMVSRTEGFSTVTGADYAQA